MLFDGRERSGGSVVATACSDPGRLAAGACDVDGRRDLFVVNLTPEARRATVGPFHGQARVTSRCLDGSSVEAAMFRPVEFRSAGRPAAVEDGAIQFDLGPYAVWTARCDPSTL